MPPGASALTVPPAGSYNQSMETGFCSFSGHRSLPREAEPQLRRLLRRKIEEQAEAGRKGFLCGGAVGFDTLAAEAVLSLRTRLPELTLTLALPCPDHDRRWSGELRARFAAIREAADEIILVSPEYHRYCMLQRNRFLVDHSSFLICYLTQASGGTAYTAGYALKKGIPVVNLAAELE